MPVLVVFLKSAYLSWALFESFVVNFYENSDEW